jgi:hypothetical protein
MSALPSPASYFASAFGRAAWKGVEYSMDVDPRRHAVTVAGDAGLVDSVRGFAGSLLFAGAWAWAMDRYVEQVRPDAFLFRVDWQGEQPLAATLYCRFPVEPDSSAFATAMRAAHPIVWRGPDPHAVASALGVPGPRGIGLRVIATGSCSAAVYFRVPDIRPAQASRVLTALVDALRLPVHLAEDVEEDLRGLSSASGGVVGVGVDEETGTSLKLNPPNVPMGRAFAFLRDKGAGAERIDAIRNLALSLRADSLSYLGIRYGAHGFTGWRAYLSLETYRIAVPLQPRITLERGALPTLRLPHD